MLPWYGVILSCVVTLRSYSPYTYMVRNTVTGRGGANIFQGGTNQIGGVSKCWGANVFQEGANALPPIKETVVVGNVIVTHTSPMRFDLVLV